MDMDRFRHHLSGPVASINTPFLENDGIDYDGLRRFVDFCIEAGAGTVLFTPGTVSIRCSPRRRSPR